MTASSPAPLAWVLGTPYAGMLPRFTPYLEEAAVPGGAILVGKRLLGYWVGAARQEEKGGMASRAGRSDFSAQLRSGIPRGGQRGKRAALFRACPACVLASRLVV